VDIACSGIYSLIGFVVFSAFIAYIIRESPKKKLATLLMGIPLIVALNISE
jgi:exosortase/archaeosortase family protein